MLAKLSAPANFDWLWADGLGLNFAARRPDVILFCVLDAIKKIHETGVKAIQVDPCGDPEGRSRQLTHCGRMTPYGDIDLGQHWLR